MRGAWLGVFLIGVAAAGCDEEMPLPAEELADTEGPDDDDDGSGSSETGAPDPTADTTAEPTTDPTTDPDDPTTDPTDDTTGEDTTGTPVDPCSGATMNITQEGNVIASSVFDTLLGPAYEAELSVDGNVATSWFSAGPNEDGTESTYEWYTQFDHCIDGIAIISNAMHANPDFQEGFGFEAATIEVIDSAGATVFSQDVDLAGTPDPDVTVQPGGVLGNQILLKLRGHESEDCGGFSELVIDGRVEG